MFVNPRLALAALGLLATAGCTGKAEDTGEDTGPAVVDTGDYEVETCDVLEIRVNGEDPPRVGDEWTIFLWCDEALLTGAMIVRFDPPEVADMEENVATFIEPGKATLDVQVGRHRANREVVIADDDE
jgi:hypothetical protein